MSMVANSDVILLTCFIFTKKEKQTNLTPDKKFKLNNDLMLTH